MRVLSNLAVKKLCFCSLLFPSAGRKWNIAGTNVRSEPLSFVKSAGGAPGTRALVNPEKPDVPLNKNDAFQKVQKRHVQEKR